MTYTVTCDGCGKVITDLWYHKFLLTRGEPDRRDENLRVWHICTICRRDVMTAFEEVLEESQRRKEEEKAQKE